MKIVCFRMALPIENSDERNVISIERTLPPNHGISIEELAEALRTTEDTDEIRKLREELRGKYGDHVLPSEERVAAGLALGYSKLRVRVHEAIMSIY